MVYTFSIQQLGYAEVVVRDVEGVVQRLHVVRGRHLVPAEQVRPEGYTNMLKQKNTTAKLFLTYRSFKKTIINIFTKNIKCKIISISLLEVVS